MELKEEFKKRPKEQEEGEKREDLKGQIVELKKIVALQSVQIDSLKEDISILLGVFTKYDKVFSKRVDEFTQQAKNLSLGADELKKGMKEGIKEGAKEIIEESTQNSLKRILESMEQSMDRANDRIEETSKSLARKISIGDILNSILGFVVVSIIILGAFLGWQFRSLRKDTQERLYQMEAIQQRLTDLTTGEGKYWYSEKDKQAYFGKIKDIEKFKEQEKARK